MKSPAKPSARPSAKPGAKAGVQTRTKPTSASGHRAAATRVRRGGEYVLVPTAEYERLVVRQAARRAAQVLDAGDAGWVDSDAALTSLRRGRIAQVREERGLTQRELGRLLGVPQSRVSRLERHPDSTTLRQLKRVAEALGVEPADLL
ncbi:MAG: helix-turn-helix transcriptional regulator [Planctomycetota bacterium]|nr:helix-turn-helix transcriptional regulator [Planctomycetota bacterium]